MSEKVPASNDATNAALLTLMGQAAGQRGKQVTTTSPGDITALQQALAGLQGADYNALLQSIFQQAGTQIPGLQAATGRAVGARSYNNTAAQMAMQELLKATTLAAQEKIAAQQLQNQQTQVQAGQAIAQATKGTTQATTEKKGLDLGRAAALLALWQGLGKLQGMDFGKMFTGAAGAGSAAAGGISSPAAAAAPAVTIAPATTAAPAMATPLSSGPGPVQQLVTALTSPFMAVNNIVESFRQPAGSLAPMKVTPEQTYIAETIGTQRGIADAIQQNMLQDFPSYELSNLVTFPGMREMDTSYYGGGV